MLAVAHAITPNIDWREGDASTLPLRKGEHFDVVVCQQGLQFFPDKRAALTQMRTALDKEGRVAVATWCSDDEIPLFRELRRVAEQRLGHIADQRYGLGDAAVLEALLRAAGFLDVHCKTVSRSIRFNQTTMFLRLNSMALVDMSAAGKQMSDEERRRVVEEIQAESVPALEQYETSSGLVFELSTNLATARG